MLVVTEVWVIGGNLAGLRSVIGGVQQNGGWGIVGF
jgi:hypothetical protein